MAGMICVACLNDHATSQDFSRNTPGVLASKLVQKFRKHCDFFSRQNMDRCD